MASPSIPSNGHLAPDSSAHRSSSSPAAQRLRRTDSKTRLMNETQSRKPFDSDMFLYTRIESPRDLPPADDNVIDVVVLDMNFGLPNLGHDSLVHAIHESALTLENELGLEVRILSCDIRRSGVVLPWDPERFRLFVGTGGPGHLDPRKNSGVEQWCEGICETADWEEPLFDLFDRIRRDERMALIGFCHSFGVICRWAGIAEPVLREGGQSRGIVTYRMTEAALEHPWFSRFASELVDAPNFRVLDSRFFDLVIQQPLPDGVIALATEEAATRRDDNSITMIEIARDEEGVMPRILGANHHPEVVDLDHMEEVLDQKLSRGEVTEEWHRQRGASLRSFWCEADTDQRMRRTARYTLLDPLRFYIRKAMLARRDREVAVR